MIDFLKLQVHTYHMHLNLQGPSPLSTLDIMHMQNRGYDASPHDPSLSIIRPRGSCLIRSKPQQFAASPGSVWQGPDSPRYLLSEEVAYRPPLPAVPLRPVTSRLRVPAQ